jgi:hypothetical protein
MILRRIRRSVCLISIAKRRTAVTKSIAFSQEPRRVSMNQLEEISSLGGGRPSLPPTKKSVGGNDFASKNFG